MRHDPFWGDDPDALGSLEAESLLIEIRKIIFHQDNVLRAKV